MIKVGLYLLDSDVMSVIKKALESYMVNDSAFISIKVIDSIGLVSETEDKYDLIILDIAEHQSYILDLAHRIKNKTDMLVVLSDDPEGYKDGFRLGARRFFRKPVDIAELFVELSVLINSIVSRDRVIVGDASIDEDDILYFESENRGVCFTTLHGVMRDPDTFSNWFERLKRSHMVICHRGVCVNLKHAECVLEDTILLKNQMSLPVSRRLKATVRQALKALQK